MKKTEGAKIGKYEFMINVSVAGMMLNCMIKMVQEMLNKSANKIIAKAPLVTCTGKICTKCTVATSASEAVLKSEEMKQQKKVAYLLD